MSRTIHDRSPGSARRARREEREDAALQHEACLAKTYRPDLLQLSEDTGTVGRRGTHIGAEVKEEVAADTEQAIRALQNWIKHDEQLCKIYDSIDRLHQLRREISDAECRRHMTIYHIVVEANMQLGLGWSMDRAIHEIYYVRNTEAESDAA